MAYKNPPKDTQFGAKRGNKTNRKGRPKTFKKLRSLILAIAAEDVKEGVELTRIELMLKAMFSSKAPADRTTILKYGWGNVPEELNIKSDSRVKAYIGWTPEAWHGRMTYMANICMHADRAAELRAWAAAVADRHGLWVGSGET